MVAGEGVNPPHSPSGQGSLQISHPWQHGMAAEPGLAAGRNLGRRGAELYPSELCEKCHVCSCWRTTLITLHYLLTFQGARGAGSAPVSAPCHGWGTAACGPGCPQTCSSTCCQLTRGALVISEASKSLAKQKKGQQYLSVWACIHLSVQAGCS